MTDIFLVLKTEAETIIDNIYANYKSANSIMINVEYAFLKKELNYSIGNLIDRQRLYQALHEAQLTLIEYPAFQYSGDSRLTDEYNREVECQDNFFGDVLEGIDNLEAQKWEK